MDNLILTDADGVLLNWEYAFHTWMASRGFIRRETETIEYDMNLQYAMSKPDMKKMVRVFNESAAIGFLPPLRDAIHYVRKLHEECGYVFHVITSLSTDSHACELRTQNLKKLFGDTVFERFIYLDTGADKDEVLSEYKNSGLLWVEDKVENAVVGANLGLNSILMEHGHNMNYQLLPRAKNWKEIYNYVNGE